MVLDIRTHRSLIILFLVSLILLFVRVGIPETRQILSILFFYIALSEVFNLFTGLTLYVCFGYVAFVALGMYGGGATIKYLLSASSPPPLAVVLACAFAVAGILALILALAVGWISVRLKGAYFAIATIGLNEGLKNLIEGTGIWGGSSGLVIANDLIQSYNYDTFIFVTSELADYLIFTVYAVTILCIYLVIKSRLGYGLAALREDEEAANVMGVNVVRYKLIVFVISATLAGMLGAGKMIKDVAIYPPQAFAVSYTVEAIVISMLGGLGTVTGPVIGGLIYGVLKYVLTVSFPGLQLLALAPALMVMCVMFPYGIVGWLRRRFKGSKIESLLI
jgi:branched-chain amino acid transport system permease protein